MTSPTQGSVTCVLWLWGQPRGTRPCRPRAGLAWGPPQAWDAAKAWACPPVGPEGPRYPGAVSGPHLRAGVNLGLRVLRVTPN